MKLHRLRFAVTHRYRTRVLDYICEVDVCGSRRRVHDAWLTMLDSVPVKKTDEKKQLRAMAVWLEQIEDSKRFWRLVEREVKYQRAQGVIP
jgi:hypothetical protein